MTRITATEASRNFSEILNRVAAGEEFEVVRNGIPIARLMGTRPMLISAERFHEVVGRGRADEAFADAMRALRASADAPRNPWQSS
ncbi:MAG: type II toxin-antitoxin system Phd/YefM family antitoxin [Thermoleophilia bacterium]